MSRSNMNSVALLSDAPLAQIHEQVHARPDGPLDFPPPDGGCLNTPCLSRLLRIVELNGKLRSKAR